MWTFHSGVKLVRIEYDLTTAMLAVAFEFPHNKFPSAKWEKERGATQRTHTEAPRSACKEYAKPRPMGRGLGTGLCFGKIRGFPYDPSNYAKMSQMRLP